jgi:hypothetical protein
MLFEKLQSFAKEHSHCKVPKGYTNDPELANWVRNQRLEYANLQRNKKTRMTADRVEKLNALGFKWSTAVPSRRTYADTKEGKKTQVQELSTAPKHPTSASWLLLSAAEAAAAAISQAPKVAHAHDDDDDVDVAPKMEGEDGEEALVTSV